MKPLAELKCPYVSFTQMLLLLRQFVSIGSFLAAVEEANKEEGAGLGGPGPCGGHVGRDITGSGECCYNFMLTISR
jgi:hypothetical protein